MDGRGGEGTLKVVGDDNKHHNPYLVGDDNRHDNPHRRSRKSFATSSLGPLGPKVQG